MLAGAHTGAHRKAEARGRILAAPAMPAAKSSPTVRSNDMNVDGRVDIGWGCIEAPVRQRQRAGEMMEVGGEEG